jgi:hypothetical protein
VANAECEEPAEIALELLHGIARTLMSVDARLERIEELVGEDDEGANADA